MRLSLFAVAASRGGRLGDSVGSRRWRRTFAWGAVLGVGCASPFGGDGPGAVTSTNTDAGPGNGDAGTVAVPMEGGPAPKDAASPPPDAHIVLPPPPAKDAAPPPPSCNATPARGAAVPYQEYEAENATTNGTVLGPSRAVNDPDVFNSIAGESSGRQAVKLSGTGQNLSFKTSCVANSVVVRYVIPDSADGSDVNATLGLYVNGTRVQSLPLTTRYAWAYGDPTKSDATTNNPSDGFARHFYDETRVILAAEIPTGTTVTIQQDAMDTAGYYVIDLVDLEEVPPPLGEPANALSITDYGATPNDGSDDGAAIQKCINAAEVEKKIVWIPPGVYLNGGSALVAQGVTIQGAGMWLSTIQGAAAAFVCAGYTCIFSDFSLAGDVTLRDDAHGVHAIGGPFGGGSRIDNVWMEHFTTGPWIGQGGSAPIDGLVIHGCRIRDLFADGVNLNTGTTNATVEQCHARNTGDDAFAVWSSGGANGVGPAANNVFQFDSVQVTWRASGFAIYGGTGNTIEDSTCADTVTYPGILIDQGFDSSSFSGTTSVTRNTLERAGGGMYGTSWGALTVWGDQMSNAITGVQVQTVDIDDATFSGIFLVGPNDAIQDLLLTDVTIANPATFGIDVDKSASGTATATNVVVTGPGSGTGLNNQAPSVYTIDRGGGDVGW
jgi:hypothetical protein